MIDKQKRINLLLSIVLILFTRIEKSLSIWETRIIPVTQEFSTIRTMKIGKGRNDGKNNLYLASGYSLPGCVGEVRYVNGNWEVNIIDKTNSDTSYYIGDIGDARNDGINRIYIFYQNNKTYQLGYIYEYTWAGSSWTKTMIDVPPYYIYWEEPEIAEIGIGQGRNDGVNRIYAVGDNYTYEYTWTGSSWTYTVIAKYGWSRLYKSLSNNLLSPKDVIITDGRNDGINRVYMNDEEYTWTGSSWTEVAFSLVSQMNIFSSIKKDGIKRLYYVDNPYYFPILYERTWNVDRWVTIPTINFEQILPKISSKYPGDIRYYGEIIGVGDGFNDSVNRIYIYATYSVKGHLFEVIWSGQKWNVNGYEVPEPKKSVFTHLPMIIGDLHNDGKNRFYIVGSLHEYTYSPPYDKNQLNDDKLVPVNNYVNINSANKMSIMYKMPEAGDVSLRIYDLNGSLVKTLMEGWYLSMEGVKEWDGTDEYGDKVGSGIYLVHLYGPGVNIIKKICVVR